MLKRQFGISDIWVTLLLHINFFKQLENNNNATEGKKNI